MNEKNRQIVHGVIAQLLEKIGFDAEVMVEEDPVLEGGFVVSVSVAEGQNFLIGQYGMNLAALQHLVRILVRKEAGEKLDIVVDVNGYLAEKRQLLEKEAEKAVEEALQNGITVALRPMLPYERKIVHSFLSKNPSVATESAGTGENRKVMVSPKPMTGA